MSGGKSKSRVLHPHEEYWLALGQFVSHFSQLERQLQLYLMIEAKVSPQTAQAIFSGVKIDQTKSFIKRLREVSGKPTSPFLDRIFAQMTIITSARNDILHYGATFENGTSLEGIVSNVGLAMPGRETKFPVSPSILNQLTIDLNSVMAGLAIVIVESIPMPENVRSQLNEFMATFRKSAEAPWQYKSPKQVHTRQPRQKGARKQSTPPQPSRG